MAGMILPGAVAGLYQGLAQIFEFVNGDGERCAVNCGQAAAATFLTHHGIYRPQTETDARDIMTAIETDHPPDNFGGYFGTSRRRVERICRAHGLRVSTVRGEDDLKRHLDLGEPVIVMVGLDGPKLFGRPLPAGHWMVAYGHDSEAVYMTNGGRWSWSDFRDGWKRLVPRTINMRNTGIAAKRV